MQETRRRILEILKERGYSTVAELAGELEIAPVSVRHHLDILLSEDLIYSPRVQRKGQVGRPQQVYALTDAAADHFPNNLCALANQTLDVLKSTLSENELRIVVEQMAVSAAAEAPPPRSGQRVEERLQEVVEFLNEKGYLARWEVDGECGFLLHTCNCPYVGVAEHHPELCRMDATLVRELFGDAECECVARQVAGDLRCSYRVKLPEKINAVAVASDSRTV